ncbi:Myristylated membrane protein A [Lymphocystis disease virus 1]|uniref:Myristylated membrane protein A n=1 Tax=Fish lymphocystis disease virus TaxID=36363 RepID=UPI0000161EB0|nr:Myristylated membrane protein A [Lymphocystis disease virus 1]
MGMSTSKNLSDIITNAFTNISSDIIKSQVTDINNSQIVSISNIDGDVDISDVLFVQILDINMRSLMNVLSEQKAQQELLEQIAQNAKAVTSGLNTLQFSYAVNQVTAITTACAQIAVRINDSCTFADTITQEITLQNVKGNINIKDLKLNQIDKVFEDCAQEAISQNELTQHITEELKQKSSASSTGVSFLIVLVALVVTVAVTGIKLIGPICFMAGMAGFYYYYNFHELVYKGYTVEPSKDLVHNVIRKPGLSLINAVEQLNASQYQALYWKNYDIVKNYYTKLPIPETMFFSDTIDETLVAQDTGNFTLAPNFLQNYGLPHVTAMKTSVQVGDYYLNQDTGIYYKYSVDGEWEKFNEILHLAEWNIAMPIDKPRSDNDLYGRFINPLTLQLYKFKDNSWVEYQKINTGVELFKKLSTPNTLVVKKYYKYILYGSICLTIVGIIISITEFYKNESAEL